jgi:hypothetical protein
MLFCKTNSANQTQDSKQSKNFQHVSAGPQPIFGLAVGLRGLGAAGRNMRGHPGGAMKCPKTYSPTASLISTFANSSSALLAGQKTEFY